MLEDRKVIAIERVVLVHSPEEHPFHRVNHAAAAENWSLEKARQPALFDGQVMLASAVAVEDTALKATCHLVPFSTFLYWRARRPVEGAVHIFAMAVPIGSDGGVLVTEMGAATVNAGMFYCPAGSFDPDDLVDGRFDPDANMAREVAEETGLDLLRAEREPGYNAVLIDGALTVFRAFRFAESAPELVARVERHIADEPDPELAGAFAVNDAGGTSARYAAHMPLVLARYFGTG